MRLNKQTGLLPPGEHSFSWSEVNAVFGTTAHRRYLLECAREVCLMLKNAGVGEVWLDGSFVTSKERPNDYDLSYVLTEDIFARLPTDPFKLANADRLIRSRFSGDVKAEPMPDGFSYHKDLFPNVVDHIHNGRKVSVSKKGIVLLSLATLT